MSMTMKTASTTRANLKTAIDDLIAALQTADLQEQVEIGSILWGLINQASKSIDPIKDTLRKETLKQTNNSEGEHTFRGIDGGLGSCTVRVPRASMKVSGSADMGELRSLLGSKFDQLFETSMSYKVAKDFQDKVVMMADEEADAVMEVIDMVSNKPRVSFHA